MSFDAAKHKNTLVKILKDIYTDASLGPILGFKGGTAAHLFYNLSRFSVDLDFDLLDKSKEDYVFERVKKILEEYGILRDAKKKDSDLFYLLSYDEKEERAQNIKIDINLRDFGSKYEIKSYLGISMKVMVKEDIVANKLVAMYERTGETNRDIFDVWFFLNNEWSINKEIVEKRTNLLLKEFLQKNIELLEEKNNKNILAGMGELLDEKQKVWVKEKLKNETVFLLKLRLDNIS